MGIPFCDQCDASVPRADLEAGLARRWDGRLYCAACAGGARRARRLRAGLVLLALAAAAGVGAALAVLILRGRIGDLEGEVAGLGRALVEARSEQTGTDAALEGLGEVIREQREAVMDLRRAFEEGAVETADLVRLVSEHAAANARRLRAIQDVIARRIAAEAGRREGDSIPDEVGIWVQLFTHDDPRVRLSALVALEGVEDERVDAALPSRLADEDSAVRAQAAAMAGRRGLDRTLPALALLLEDESLHVRKAAGDAFREISGRDFGFDATDGREEREKALAKIRVWLAREE